MDKEWRWVPGLEGIYKVSDTGQVFSFVRTPGRYLKPGRDVRGYRRVKLGGKWYKLHRVVLARRYGISTPAAQAICKGRHWRHVA